MSDNASTRAKKTVRGALILSGMQVVGALALTFANKLGWIDSETVNRGVMVLIGLMLITIGNSLPKQQDGPPSQTVRDIAVRQAITRFGGWALLLGGSIWVGLWTLAPRKLAELGSVAAVGTAVLAMIVYAIWRVRTHRPSAS